MSQFHIVGPDSTYISATDASLRFRPGSRHQPPAAPTTAPIPASMTGPAGEKVASVGPWLAAGSEAYRLAQPLALDPASTTKVANLVAGIRQGPYGNVALLQMYEYGFGIYTASKTTPRYRLNKRTSGGTLETALTGYGFYDDIQVSGSQWRKRGLCWSVPLEQGFVPALGTDGGMCVWDPWQNELTELWQMRWEGRPAGATTGGVPTVTQAGRLSDLTTVTDPVYPRFNGQWFHGLSASRLAAAPFVIKIEELDRAIDEGGAIRDTITVTRPDGSTDTIDALDTIEHVVIGAVSDAFSAKNPAVSFPARYNDSYSGPTQAEAISYGQICRFPSSINWRTWTPDGWGDKDQRTLSLMRLVGRAVQKHGFMLVDRGGTFGVAAQTNDTELRDALIARIPGRQNLAGWKNPTTGLGNGSDITLLPWEQLEACALRTT